MNTYDLTSGVNMILNIGLRILSPTSIYLLPVSHNLPTGSNSSTTLTQLVSSLPVGAVTSNATPYGPGSIPPGFSYSNFTIKVKAEQAVLILREPSKIGAHTGHLDGFYLDKAKKMDALDPVYQWHVKVNGNNAYFMLAPDVQIDRQICYYIPGLKSSQDKMNFRFQFFDYEDFQFDQLPLEVETGTWEDENDPEVNSVDTLLQDKNIGHREKIMTQTVYTPGPTTIDSVKTVVNGYVSQDLTTQGRLFFENILDIPVGLGTTDFYAGGAPVTAGENDKFWAYVVEFDNAHEQPEIATLNKQSLLGSLNKSRYHFSAYTIDNPPPQDDTYGVALRSKTETNEEYRYEGGYYSYVGMRLSYSYSKQTGKVRLVNRNYSTSYTALQVNRFLSLNIKVNIRRQYWLWKWWDAPYDELDYYTDNSEEYIQDNIYQDYVFKNSVTITGPTETNASDYMTRMVAMFEQLNTFDVAASSYNNYYGSIFYDGNGDVDVRIPVLYVPWMHLNGIWGNGISPDAGNSGDWINLGDTTVRMLTEPNFWDSWRQSSAYMDNPSRLTFFFSKD